MRTGHWLNFRVTGEADWPREDLWVEFDGHELLLRPRTFEHEASLHLEYADGEMPQAKSVASQFLSIVSWGSRASIRLREGWGAWGKPARIPLNRLHRLSGATQFLVKWSAPREARQRLALALYREAKNSESIPYEFLSYFKVINILADKGAAQQHWITQALPHVTNGLARERISELEDRGVDVAHHLYTQGRCAVAHAFANPLVNPDETADVHSLYEDLFLIEMLAEHAITNDLGLERFFYDERTR